MSPEQHRKILRDIDAEIARDRAAMLAKLAEHQGLNEGFLNGTFLEIRGLFAPTAYMPDTPENRHTLNERVITFGYDVIGGLRVALLAYQDLSWIAPVDLHALADGRTVDWHPRVPWERLTRCPCASG
ncbi:hypothetical protein [Streptomyces sp. 11x1]|uniref:hypothetical protein n=1 Tax=Streptomyces sp. 11x1 TaxID=3038642 RepID=UPI00292CEA46|nr:hypothetical protein [Streptomyces sp. 11x1]WNZ14901.1 hypothetical protein P8T65_46545 [Streptomyces sp. 11x1]